MVYSDISNKYPSTVLWLKEGYYAFFLIVIYSGDIDLYIVFTVFTASNLIILYISEIDPFFSKRHPVIYRIILTVTLLIIVFTIIFLASTVYTRILRPRKPSGGKPTDQGSNKNTGGPEGPEGPGGPGGPEGPSGNNNVDSHSNSNEKTTKKRKNKKSSEKPAAELEEEKEEKKRKKKNKC